MTTENLIGWGIAGFIGLWWLGWLFTRGASAARKDRALRTGDASVLTPEDKAENRAVFIADLSKPGAAIPGSTMHSASACATLGAVMIAVGVVVGMLEEGTSGMSSMPLGGGVLLLLVGGALALGGGK